MQEDAVLFEWVGAALLLLAAARVAAVGLRGRLRPECLLGAALLLRFAGYPLSLTPGVFQQEPVWSALVFCSRISFGLSVLLLAMFTRERFRVGEPWASGAVLGSSLMVAGGILLSLLKGDWVGWSPLTNPWVWLEWSGLTAPMVWLTTEAISRLGDVRRRLRMGLDVADTRIHYRLLAAFGSALLLGQVSVLALYIQYESQNRVTLLMDALVGGFEGLAAVAAWAAYSRCVLRPGRAAHSCPLKESAGEADA